MVKIGFYGTTLQGSELYGYLTYDGNEFKTFPTPGNTALFENVLKPTNSAERALKRKNPDKWVKSLPLKFNGTYLQAHLEQS